MKATQDTTRNAVNVHVFTAGHQFAPKSLLEALSGCRLVHRAEEHRLGLGQVGIWPRGIRVLYAAERMEQRIAEFAAQYSETNASPLVFVSDSEKLAVSAFLLGAVDYLVAPSRPERLEAAVARAMALGRPAEHVVQGLLDSLQAVLGRSSGRDDVIVCRTTNVIQMIPVGEVRWIEGDRNYFKLHSEGGVVRKRGSLSQLERRLPSQFHRVHRSAIVNMEKVVRIDRFANATGQAVLDDGSKIPISRARKLHRMRPVLD